MEEDKIILTAADIGVWAYGKFAKQEKAIKRLNRESSSFAFSIILLSSAVCMAAYTIKKQKLMIDELQAQIDALKPASE